MQDDVPVTDQSKAEGHAVRAMYLYSGMSDVAALAGDAAYATALDRIWNDVVSKRLYLTGGLGARDTVEAFGDDYELPNRTAYTETCASVGGVLWNQRMFLREGDAKYLDVVERTLYNGFLSGVSLAGDTFFYQNPLASDGTVARTAYFEVACCPSNLARLMGQLPSLIYARKDDELYVNQFVASHATLDLGGRSVMVAQQTGYPWDGVVTIRLASDQPTAFTLHVRIPGWARNEPVASDLYRFADVAPAVAGSQPTLSVNGQPVALDVAHGFASIRRTWAPGDTVRLDLPMPVRRVVANPGVTADEGRLAIERGPIVYALEGVDNGGKVSDLTLAAGAALGHECIGLWKLVFFDRRVFEPDPSKSAQWNRGAYLVNGAGHCAECHSPRNAFGAIVADKRFTGGPNPEGKGWVPNITQKGLADWSAKDIAYLLQSGMTPDGDFVGSSMEEVTTNTALISDADRHSDCDLHQVAAAGRRPAQTQEQAEKVAPAPSNERRGRAPGTGRRGPLKKWPRAQDR